LVNVGTVGLKILAFPLTSPVAYTIASCYSTSLDYWDHKRRCSGPRRWRVVRKNPANGLTGGEVPKEVK